MAQYAIFDGHAAALNYIQRGRNKKNRPLYTRGASIRAVEPDNPKTDITINWRWRHVSVDEQYRESLLRPTEVRSAWSVGYPLAIIKSDDTITLTSDFKQGYSARQVWKRLIGPNLLDIRLRNGTVKVHLASDPLRGKRAQRCRVCKGQVNAVATCWEKHGIVDEDLSRMISPCSWVIKEPHETHIVKLLCHRCMGSGLAGDYLSRLDSYKWTDHSIDLVFDMQTGLLLRKEIVDVRRT